ncbi:uncharacterized protein LOC143062546 [Mytilus galloprovincialis]|uniref:uncharacterized protein LOC143062546 n=1 Tax=Mytilus galloprovincialis TaxID=29158 RepID=UPI003F7C6E2B
MPSARECVCCCEVSKIDDVKNEHTDTACITDNPGFHPLCLDTHVLKVAYYQYRQQYGEHPYHGNERNRYTEYRQFLRWCWQFLGKEVRVVIPSCVLFFLLLLSLIYIFSLKSDFLKKKPKKKKNNEAPF